MAVAAILATQLTDRAVRLYSLTVGGLDVVSEPVNGRYLVDLDSVTVTQTRDAVGTLRFAIQDSAALVNVDDGQEVVLHDIANDYPIFGGFVASWSIEPWASGGRTITVQAVSYDTILDWCYVPTFTIPNGGPGANGLREAIQYVIALIVNGTMGLRSFGGGVGGSAESHDGSEALPTGSTGNSLFNPTSLTFPGGSLRDALAWISANQSYYSDGSVPRVGWAVDSYRGLRVWRDNTTLHSGMPSDYVALTVTDSGTNSPVNLDYDLDATQIVRAVYITGGNAAGTGLVTDGTGRPGKVASYSDSSILTADALNRAGISYLQQFNLDARGTVTFDKVSPTLAFSGGSYVGPGSLLTLTSAQTGATASWRIYSITRNQIGRKGGETWTVGFGGLPPNVGRLSRRLTRGVRS